MTFEECIFCKIAKGEIHTEKIKETNNFFSIHDANPISEGHIIIIPKKHFVTLLDIPNKLGEELLKFIKQNASKILDDKTGDGFNLIMNNLEVADQVIKHAHIHLIPRKENDKIKIINKRKI